MTDRLPLLLTMGEPAGIGPELALMTWLRRKDFQLPPFAIVGDPAYLGQVSKHLNLDVAVTVVEPHNIISTFDQTLPVVPVELGGPVTFGLPDTINAQAVIKSIETTVDIVRQGIAKAIVTCPIQKSVLADAGFAYPGHTEFLASLAVSWPDVDAPPHPVMMLASEDLRIVPATIHIPLSMVADALTTEMLLETGQIIARALEDCFGVPMPRLRFCGLNPHAGEDGKMGNEEKDIIAPAISLLQQEGISAEGPFAADTMFHESARDKYDVAIAMYHDQALIPIKTLAFDQAVNVTLGLPFIRTSPDHGTALDIAGTGKASCASLVAAIRMADTMMPPKTT